MLEGEGEERRRWWRVEVIPEWTRVRNWMDG